MNFAFVDILNSYSLKVSAPQSYRDHPWNIFSYFFLRQILAPQINTILQRYSETKYENFVAMYNNTCSSVIRRAHITLFGLKNTPA